MAVGWITALDIWAHRTGRGWAGQASEPNAKWARTASSHTTGKVDKMTMVQARRRPDLWDLVPTYSQIRIARIVGANLSPMAPQRPNCLIIQSARLLSSCPWKGPASPKTASETPANLA